MKKLFIIDDRRPLWSDIALTLEEMNAEIHILTKEEAEQAFEKERPDLLVLGDQSLNVVPLEAKQITKLVLCEDAPPGDVIRAREGRKIVRLGLPLDKKVFLDLTSRILSVAERRAHQSPVLVVTKEGEAPIEGESEDFSITGMAFRSSASFTPRQEVSVSFREEDRPKDLRFEAAVVRKSPGRSGEATLYGVRFIRLSPADRHALERFVWRIRRRVS